MLDNALIQLIISSVHTGLTAISADMSIIQSNQPTQQGAPSAATLFLYKVGDKRVGYPYKEDVWNSGLSQMQHTVTEQYETTFQFSALAPTDPTNINAITTSDMLNYAAYVLQLDSTVALLEAQGCGILAVQQVRNPYFSNDSTQFQAAPSFDFTVTHKQVIVTTTPIIKTIATNIVPI